jgi:hypothetical protein
MPLVLTEDLVLCCEGEADRQFIRKMTEKRAGLPICRSQLTDYMATGPLVECWKRSEEIGSIFHESKVY